MFISVLTDALCKAVNLLIVACLATMVALVLGNVVLRYGFDSGISASEELSRWLFVWLTFLGSIVALRHDGHVSADIFAAKLPKGAQKVLRLVCLFIIAVLNYWLFEGAWAQTLLNAETVAPVTGLSEGYFFYASGMVFALGSVLVLLEMLLKTLFPASVGKSRALDGEQS